MPSQKPVVGLIMGSQSDWPTLKPASEILKALGVEAGTPASWLVDLAEAHTLAWGLVFDTPVGGQTGGTCTTGRCCRRAPASADRS